MKKNLKFFLLYFFLTALFFSKPLLQGKLFAYGDALIVGFPMKFLYKYEFFLNGINLWIPYYFLGMPYKLIQMGALYPLNFIYFFIPPQIAFNFLFLLHYSLAGFFTFIYLRKLGLKRLSSFLGGIMFSFSGHLMAQKSHISMIVTFAWFPLILFFIEKLKEDFNYRYVILIGILLSFQILGGHFQIFVYFSTFIIFYSIFLSIGKSKFEKVKFLSSIFLSFLISIVLSLPKIFITLDLLSKSFRQGFTYNDFTVYSLPPFFLIHSIFPYIFGGGYGGNYIGPWTLEEISLFAGTFPVFLAFYLFFKKYKENRYVLFFGIVSIISIIFAMGKYLPVYRILFYIPFYNKFRCPSRILVLYSFSISVIFSFAVNYLFFDRSFKAENLKKIIKYFILIFLSVIFIIIFLKTFLSYLIEINFITKNGAYVVKNYLNFKSRTFLIPSIFVVSYVIFLLLFKYYSEKKYFPLAFFVILFSELFSFGYFYRTHQWNIKLSEIPSIFVEKPNKFFTDVLKKDSEIYRVIIFDREGFELTNLFSKIQFLNGYDPLEFKNFREMLDIRPNGVADIKLALNNILLSFLNVKYVIVKDNFKKKIDNIYYTDRINSRVISEFSNKIIFKTSDKKAGKFQKLVNIKPNTFYMISVELKGDADGFFVADLFRWKPRYDFKEQELWIPSYKINKDSFRTFFKIINTGSKAPDRVYFRIFTKSTRPLKIRKAELIEIGEIYAPFSLIRSDMKEGRIYDKILEREGYILYKNTNYLPRTFFVESIIPVKDIYEIKKKFYLFDFNPFKTALLFEKDFENIKQMRFSKGKAIIKKYTSSEIIIHTENDNSGFLILTDQYYPGWKAYIDGKETKIYMVNGLVRGIVILPGKHNIVFRYEPIPIILIIICSILLFAILLSIIVINSFCNNIFKKF